MTKLRMIILQRACVIIMLSVLSACAEKQEPAGIIAGYDSGPHSEARAAQNQKPKFMAYEHSLSLEVEKQTIAPLHIELVSRCEADTQFDCVVLNSRLTAGKYQSSQISLRVAPNGIAFFSKLATSQGRLASQSTRAQDLSDSVRDNAKRTQMATQYRDKLLALESKEGNDIDAMVKIASELSNVQAQLEFSEGERAKLFNKIETELLNIQISAPTMQGFWAPISDAFASFGEDLSYGISSVISSSASIVPWFIFLIILFLVARVLFRLFRSKK